MKVLCIIACGKRKIWDENTFKGPVNAKELYTGSFTRKCVEYAEKFHKDSYCILSAKYGFLYPNETVDGPYDECFHLKDTNPITIEELQLEIKDKELDKYRTIFILGGKHYFELIMELFPKKEIINPLEGCKGIGDMMKRLNEMLS